MLTLITWCGDLVALVTGIAMIKDTFVDAAAWRRMGAALADAWSQLRQARSVADVLALRSVLRFAARIGTLVLIVASAGVCVVFPAVGDWQGMLLRTALALHMAEQVPCPWYRWITIGDARAKLNDPPGVERRVQR